MSLALAGFCMSLKNSVRAPKIYFHDADEGLIWIEDLGERDLFSYRDESWLVRRAFYESALDEAGKLHSLPAASVQALQANLRARARSNVCRLRRACQPEAPRTEAQRAASRVKLATC